MNHAIGIALIGTLFALAGTAVAASAGPARGASAVDVAEGDRLAHTLCVNCHVVDTRSPIVRTDQVPSFPWVAQQPGLTQEFLTGWLSTSHSRMPDYALTREEIRQLSAYIVSLKNP